MLIVTAIVATGAGLHVAAYFIERTATIGPLATCSPSRSRSASFSG
jgi:hypothetical protein